MQGDLSSKYSEVFINPFEGESAKSIYAVLAVIAGKCGMCSRFRLYLLIHRARPWAGRVYHCPLYCYFLVLELNISLYKFKASCQDSVH